MRAGTDRFAAARAVADALLYEGYVLYPYRASAQKNRLRFQFGVLVPPACCESDGNERSVSRTECILDPGAAPLLATRVRFLQVQHRGILAGDGPGRFRPVERLEVDDKVFVEWDEAVEHTVDLPPVELDGKNANTIEANAIEANSIEANAIEQVIFIKGDTDTELIRCGDGSVAGQLVRRRETLYGRVRVAIAPEPAERPLLRLSVTVENLSPWAVGTRVSREETLARSLIAVHTLLAVDDGRFVSLLDPPEQARQAVAKCDNVGAFPVLIGSEDDVVLSSPIILYDHPEVASESPGDLYDATEIDEILALRVLTLTDEEKSEARATDPRAAAIVDRCDDMAPELWDRLHAAVRSIGPTAPPPDTSFEPLPAALWWDPLCEEQVDPWSDALSVGGVEIRKGSAVVLRPSHRADAQDLFLAGLNATVAGVFLDVDGDEHVAVTINSDPASEAFDWQGRYLFFHPDEIEPIAEAGPSR